LLPSKTNHQNKDGIRFANILPFLFIPLAIYSLACFVFINFVPHKIISWSFYWQSIKYIFPIVVLFFIIERINLKNETRIP